jgi:hypothetical protein
MMTGLYDKDVMAESRKNKPRRRLHLRGLSTLCPTSGRTLVMGLHPLFRFDCRRRSGSLIRTLAPRQAKPGLLSGGVSSMSQDPPANGFRPPGGRIGIRATFRRQKIRSPPDLSRLNHRALGALGSNCGCRNSFSRRQKRAPETGEGQHETAAEILCEVRKDQGTWRVIPISTESLIRSAVRPTPSLDLI